MTERPSADRNALRDETSPYLLQHAGNPVEWFPWDARALDLARRLDKPILLSIGYSACHWCHVMAHESFEDPATAALMNEHFVNIKVDREERPDLDRIYQQAHQLLTGRGGGWPLTLFLSPRDQVPYFAGTYFPRHARHGLPAFSDLVVRGAEFYRSRAEEVHAQSGKLREALAALAAGPAASGGLPGRSPLQRALEQALAAFDRRHGGFGAAPKFPHAGTLARLLREPDTDDQRREARRLALLTLDRMAAGGLYDQLGGGFFRYSTDSEWEIPHFEKMLYDNAALLDLYGEAWAASGDPRYADLVRGVAAWLAREMSAAEGGFHSSLDADSEGEEGRFYVWQRAEAATVLGPAYALFAAHSGLEEPANFEDHWHLQRRAAIPELVARFALPAEDVALKLEEARRALFVARGQRVRPGCDDKILTSWNALTIKALARTGSRLGETAYVDQATRALDFLRSALWRDGRLLATWRAGRAHLPAYLDDHAFLLDALLALLQARWRRDDLDFAIALAEALLERFEDRAAGGFYFTAHDHETLVSRPKSQADDALPAGAGVAAQALNRLGHLLGEERYVAAAERAVANSRGALEAAPMAHEALLLALEEMLDPPEIVIIRAPAGVLEAWLRSCVAAGFAPHRLVVGIPSEEAALPGLLAARVADATRAVAYVCTGTTCRQPLHDLTALRALLTGSSLDT